MGIGPIIFFDKSTLQSLSVDESVWLDTHYKAIITPLFFVETLADLSKEVSKGRSPEEVVGNLADKTPASGPPNMHHSTLCLAELYGNTIEMSRRPVISGGKRTSSGDKTGMIFEQAPELDAIQRWQKKEFLEIEHEFAGEWRKSLSGIDLDLIFQQGRDIIKKHGRPNSLEEAKQLAEDLLNKPGSRYALEGVKLLVPDEHRMRIMKLWRKSGTKTLKEYAPYTYHIVLVDLFFCIAIGADLIGRERPSNKVDLAYLYYLPFCMVFTSRDKLHIRTVPLFLSDEQVFIHGDDLKKDLSKLDDYYSSLPDEVKETGVMSFAHFPPTDGDFLTSKIWDQLMSPTWREPNKKPSKPDRSEEIRERLKEEIEQISKHDSDSSDSHSLSSDEVDHLVIQIKTPMFKGKWRLLPPSIGKKNTEK